MDARNRELALTVELARRRLGDFAGVLIDDYAKARHTNLLCDRLEQLERRDIRRLVVQLPPGAGKSTNVSRAFVAWYLGRNPTHNIALTSHAATLAEDNSRAARTFFESPRWPFPNVRISQDTAAVGRWATTAGGGVRATGILGSLTGFRANVLVVDDPVADRDAANSEAAREAAWRWFAEVGLTRLEPDAIVIIVQTRWHTDDLAGRVLSSPGAEAWELLSLPAIALDDDPLGRAPGEPLWPDRFPLEVLVQLREDLGSRAFGALFQQSPTDDVGGIFQRPWFEGRYARLPEGVKTIQAIDSAFKAGVSNDWSVIATWATDGVWYYLVDVWRKKVEYPELVAAIKAQAGQHRPSKILVEDAASGQSVAQTLKVETNLPIIPVPPKGSKTSRAEGVSPLFEGGKVLLPEQSPSWLEPWVTEHISFPATKHDDMVDTTSMALHELRGKRSFVGGAIAVYSRPDGSYADAPLGVEEGYAPVEISGRDVSMPAEFLDPIEELERDPVLVEAAKQAYERAVQREANGDKSLIAAMRSRPPIAKRFYLAK